MPDTEGAATRLIPDEKIITPHREVTLSNGTRVLVAPWGMTQGSIIMARLEALQPRLAEAAAEGPITPHALLSKAWEEIVDIVSLTVAVERSEMERPVLEGGWTFEDLLAVTDAVLDVCLIRSDGRGVLPLLMALVGRMNELEQRSRGSSGEPTPSGTSGKAGTSRGRSGNGSGSRRNGRARRGRG